MQKNDLVKEIEDFLDGNFILRGSPTKKFTVGIKDALDLLQRAREALSWIPVEEWIPEKGVWEVTVHHDLDDDYFTSFYLYTGEDWLYPTEHGWNSRDFTRVVAVKRKTPPYTPEES